MFTIGHIAVPKSAQIVEVTRIVAVDRQGRQLSDHDGYTTDWRLTDARIRTVREGSLSAGPGPSARPVRLRGWIVWVQESCGRSARQTNVR